MVNKQYPKNLLSSHQTQFSVVWKDWEKHIWEYLVVLHWFRRFFGNMKQDSKSMSSCELSYVSLWREHANMHVDLCVCNYELNSDHDVVGLNIQPKSYLRMSKNYHYLYTRSSHSIACLFLFVQHIHVGFFLACAHVYTQASF